MITYNVKIAASLRGAIGILYTEKRSFSVTAHTEGDARDQAHIFASTELGLDHVHITSIEEA